MSRFYDAPSEILSLYSHPMTRASSSTQDSEHLATPLDEASFHRGQKPGVSVPSSRFSSNVIKIRSETPELQLNLSERQVRPPSETGQYDVEPYGPYFSLPVDPIANTSALTRRRTTKELIGRYESMNSQPSSRASHTSAVGTERYRKPRGAYPGVERKDKSRSPIRQSIRNFLSVFKKNRSSVKDQSEHSDATENRPQPITNECARTTQPNAPLQDSPPSNPANVSTTSGNVAMAICTTPISMSVRAGCSGPLLYLSRPSSPSVHPVWTNCTATLHSTHILITWHTRHGNPSTSIISFTSCTDVHSLSVSDLNPNERALLPFDAGDVKVFELLFEGKPREKFAAGSVAERASWVSAIWDAILQTQEQKIESTSVVEKKRMSEANVNALGHQDCPNPPHSPNDSKTDNVPPRSSAINVDRALPDLPASPKAPAPSPARLSLQIPSSSHVPPPHALSPLPRPPVTPTAPSLLSSYSRSSTPTRSQSPSLRHLDQRSVVKQRLAQIEGLGSPVSPTRSTPGSLLATSPTRTRSAAKRIKDDGSLQRQTSPVSSAGGSIIDVYGNMDSVSPLSMYSGCLTSVPSSCGTPEIHSDRWNQRSPFSSSRLKAATPSTNQTGTKRPELHIETLRPQSLVNHTTGDLTARSGSATNKQTATLGEEEKSSSLPRTSAGIELQKELERIGQSVKCLEGHSETDGANPDHLCMKAGSILEQLRQSAPPDLSSILEKLDHMRVECRTVGGVELRNVNPSTEWVKMNEKVDQLVALCQSLKAGNTGGGITSSMAIDENDKETGEILSLLKEAQSQWMTQGEQQTESIRYLNELNSWLEAFVNHGTSQIESVAVGVQQLCRDLGSVGEVQVTGEDGVSQPGGSLLADVRKLLTETKGREENSVALHASVNGLIAAVQEDLRKNAEARNVLTTESVVGLIDRQRQDHERMLRTLGTELSNEIRGERLRFVEAMKEATAINVQIHVEEFKKELTREVLLMTQEVGRLQRERQVLEQQIADLFAFYAKQKQAGGLLQPTARHNVHFQSRPPIIPPAPGGAHASTPTRRRPLPSPVPRPASSIG
ncbi:hypothetical protein AcV5_006976 [Taiwanofungus camphoratus]|nr:hypothetical protein AcV5_006976 [Antrodia cinnamomea]KAI0958888.1 hypothetical protein AcV7_004580 [Antrodia cinnamomea]